MTDKICWEDSSKYQNMVDASHRHPSHETPQGKKLKILIDSIQYERCLEIGCGVGDISKICHDYTGMDLPDIAEQLFRKQYPDLHWIGWDFTTNDIELEMFIKNRFDLIITSAFIDVMHHQRSMNQPCSFL